MYMMEAYIALTTFIRKKLWKGLRVAFFMTRKGLLISFSRRKLILMDLNLMLKKGKILRTSLANLLSPHHQQKLNRYPTMAMAGGGFGVQEYEFSCSNSPSPVFSRVLRRKLHFFPCINSPMVQEDKDKAVVVVPKTPPDYTFDFGFDNDNFSSSSEDEIKISEGNREERVDEDAEEFIRRFYEQLRLQSHATHLLQF